MQTTFEDMINMLNKYAPDQFAEVWDNVGAMVGNKNQEITKILLCLDVTKCVVEEAIEKNYNLIISHHPFIFNSIKSIIENDIKSKLIYSLIRNNIAVYCAHTNLDSIKGGVNSALSEKIGLVNIKPFDDDTHLGLNETTSIKSEEAVYYGLATVGLIEECTLIDLATRVKDRLSLPVVKYIGDSEKKVKKVAVFCGSFSSSPEEVMEAGVNVVITGELKHNYAVEFRDLGIAVIEAGHFRTEIGVLPVVKEAICKAFPDLIVEISSLEKDPYSYII